MFERYSSLRIGDGLLVWNYTEIYSLRCQTKYWHTRKSQYRLIQPKLNGEIWKWVMRLSYDVRRSPTTLHEFWDKGIRLLGGERERARTISFEVVYAYLAPHIYFNWIQRRALVSQCIVFCVHANVSHKYEFLPPLNIESMHGRENK